jgi:hypothetical protein
MASPWKTLPTENPGDGDVVWVRLNYWFGPPFLAQYDRTAQTFTSQTIDVFVYPFWTISRWRPQ